MISAGAMLCAEETAQTAATTVVSETAAATAHRYAALSQLRTQWTDKDRHSISNMFNVFLRAEQRLKEELAAHGGQIEEVYSGDNAIAVKVYREVLKRALEKNRKSEGVSDAVATQIRVALDESEHTVGSKLIPGVVILPEWLR